MKNSLLGGFSLALILILAGCGGGGSGGGTTPPPTQPPVTPPPVISITTGSLPGATSGVAYTATLTASGGTLPYKWTTTTLLPQGFSLSNDGVLSGTYPAFFGGNTMSIPIRVTDSAATPNVADKTFTLDIFGVTPNQLAWQPQVGEKYPDSPIQAAGGVEPIQWQVAGNLPPGLTFQKNPASTGTKEYQLAGTPTQSGSFNFSVTATDSGSPARTVTRSYTAAVEPAKLKIPTSLLPVAVVGQAYSYSFAPTGGTAPFQFTMSTKLGGTLPSGLSFDQTTGLLSGTPTAAGYVGFSLYVSDHSSPNIQTADWNFYWLLVTPAPLASHNDSIATAVPIFPGDYTASISPIRNNGGNLAADEDYYQITAAAGSTATITVGNQVYKATTGWTTSLLDPVVELVDANGHRLTACNDTLDDNPSANTPIPPDPTPNGYDDACMNWGGDGSRFGVWETARLAVKVPGSSGNTTFYVHVFDWRGDARPDMFYTLSYTQP